MIQLLEIIREEKQREFSNPSLRIKKEMANRRPEPERHSRKGGLKNFMDIDVDVPPPKKQRFTVHLTEELINDIKNAVFWTPGLTISDLVESALLQAIEAMEKKLGEKFPQRTQGLKGGRPIK